MSKRRHSDEIVFGSDSFLDILANIVGILIILIVVAGLRVSKSPATPPTATAEPQLKTAAVLVPPPTLEVEAVNEELEPAIPFEMTLPPAPPVLSPELVEQVRELESNIDDLRLRRSQLISEEQSLADQALRVRQAVATRQHDLESKTQTLQRGSVAVAALDDSLAETQRHLATLQVTLAETKAEQPEATVLKHKLTPVGRKVEENEVHFLLTRGRVSVVPINELAEELKSQLQRKKNQLLKTQRHVGMVGPISGYKMQYVIERQASSLIDELRYGTAIIRMGVSQWRIVPQPDVIAESAEQALNSHGRFLAALRAAERDAALTFWVHPDSFALHRELQEFAHEQGFEVAARPLPAGLPITGSPQGSRSVAQ